MRQKIICTALAVICLLPLTARATQEKNISVVGYSDSEDYSCLMRECIEEGGKHALEMGAIYEEQRNLKIDTLKMPYEKTHYFTEYNTAEEIKAAMEAAKRGYTEEELNLLAKVVFAEAGCDWYPDWVQRAVASVVLNRVESASYPNTIQEVVYQAGQYGCVYNGMLNRTPTKKARANAEYVLKNGSTLPQGVIGQSGAIQGKVYKKYYDTVLGTTTYFCY